MAVATNWGPPSIAGSVNEGVESILGGIKDYRTGQMLENLPRTADGSVDYQAAAAAMYRTNPGLAAQFLKMEELKGLQSYRGRALDIQQQQADTAADKSSTIDLGDRVLQTGRKGEPLRMIDKETGAVTDFRSGRATPAPASPQAQPQAAPREPPKEAIDILRSRPGTEAQFEKTFGLPPGGAKQYLEGGATTAPAPAATAAPPAPAPAPLPPPPPGTGYTEKKAFRKTQLEERAKIDNAELKKADDNIQSGRNTLTTIGEMLQLNKTAFHGPGAQLRGHIGSFTGIGGKQAGADTVVLQNKITGGALEQLRATFGGNPTEGERAILLQVQGSVGQAADVRERIFKDAAALVRRRIQFNQKYANAQRQGVYMNPEYTDNTPVD